MVTNSQSGTRVDEIADRIFRINTPVPPSSVMGGFSFNQYLVLADEPLLFHSGMRSLFPVVSRAIATIMPLEQLRYIGLSHFEADECGALNEFLTAAPNSMPVCSTIAEMVSVGDFALRPPRALADGERLDLGGRSLVWIDTPHLPHNWESGLMFEETTRTLLCGDLFTQGGHELPALTEGDLVGPSEAFRQAGIRSGQHDPYGHGRESTSILNRLAAMQPQTLAVMHGSAFRGQRADEGGRMLRDLASALAA